MAPRISRTTERLYAAADAERSRLERELARLAQRTDDLAAELNSAIERRHELRAKLEAVEELVSSQGGARPSSPPKPERVFPHGQLQGAEIRRVAVQLLANSDQADRPIHYTQWFEVLNGRGYGVAGLDPLATFLTQVSRSPVVVRHAPQPGYYVIDLEAPARLHNDLRKAQAELTLLHDGQQTIEGVAAQRERRQELIAAITRLERELSEAVAVLLPATDYDLS